MGSSATVRRDSPLVQIVEPTVHTTHEDFHHVLNDARKSGEGTPSDTHITETERKLFALTGLNFFLFASIIVDHVEIGNLSIPVVQVADAIVIVYNEQVERSRMSVVQQATHRCKR